MLKNFGDENVAPQARKMRNFVLFSLKKLQNFANITSKPAVPRSASGEKFLKFDTFSCIFKAIFLSPFSV